MAVFIASLRAGGAERMTLNLVEALAARRVPVDVVLANAEGELLPELPPQARVVDLSSRRVRGALTGLVRYLRREQPFGLISRVDHANVIASVAVALSGGRTRLVVTAANRLLVFPDSVTLSPARAYVRKQMLIPVVKWAYRRADAVVAVSRGVARELHDELRLGADHVRVIRNPVVTPQMARLAGGPPPHAWLEDHSVPVVLSVGRLVWEKDQALLLRSFSLLLKKRPARLLLFGTGALQQELESLRNRLGLTGVCELAGYCSNPYAAMARARLLVLSSQSEGSPNVLVEALACGCPVVATDCPSGPSEILDGGEFGLLAPVGDAEALADAMDRALATPWDHDALRSRAAEYSSTASAEQYLDALGYPHEWRGECRPRDAA